MRHDTLTDELLSEILQLGGVDVNLSNADIFNLADKYTDLVWQLNAERGGYAIDVRRELVSRGTWRFRIVDVNEYVYGDLISDAIMDCKSVATTHDEDYEWDYNDISYELQELLKDKLYWLINDISSDPENYFDIP